MILLNTNRIWGIKNKWNTINKMYYSVKTETSSQYNIVGEPRKTVSENEIQQFYSLSPEIIKDLTASYEDLPEVIERYVKVLEYNLPNHNQASGLAIVSAYKAFESPKNLTPKNVKLSNILGWCVDLLLCSYHINDDIMDGSEIRRGLPCWYKNPDVGLQAINDAILIEHGPFVLLKKYLSDHNCYLPCIEIIHDINLKTAFGMSLDMMTKLPNGKPNLESFTKNRFKSLAKYRATYGEFLMPIKLAMNLAKKYDNKSYKEIKNIMIKLGEYFTAQNDILDCYADPSITGKVGSDIREGKCTWLVVNALQHATKSQQELLKEHYGTPEHESELKIRSLYEELGILESFLKYEEKSYKGIRKDVEKMSKNLPQEFISKLVDTSFGLY